MLDEPCLRSARCFAVVRHTWIGSSCVPRCMEAVDHKSNRAGMWKKQLESKIGIGGSTKQQPK